MNSRNTWRWLLAAGVLFAFIFFFERHFHHPPAGPAKLLSGLNPAAVTSVRVLPKGRLEIRANRTNGVWELTQPLVYPARGTNIDHLLEALKHLTAATRITASELKKVRKPDQAYGFDPPQTALMIQQGNHQTTIDVGYKTAPGDQVFVQVVGDEPVFVVDAGLLKWIPTRADDWRNRSFVNLNRLAFDRVAVTNAGKVFELQENPNTHLWRLLLPGWETRADRHKVGAALSQLQHLRADQFVTDNPEADLDSFGLQNPELSLGLEQGTNSVLVLTFGSSPTNHADEIYARRSDRNAVITVSKKLLAAWLGPYEGFRDRHLVTLIRPLDRIEVRGLDHFALQRETNHTWRIVPQNLPADPGLVRQFITNLTKLKVADFYKDVVTPPDLPAKGLAKPARQYILETTVTNSAGELTNLVMAHLDFGTNENNKIFARREDESSLYTVKLSDFDRLPSASWQMRDRRIWHFTRQDVAKFTIHQGGRTRVILHKGTNSWTLAPGSQGIINPLPMGELAHEFGHLSAVAWVERGDQHRARYGFTTNSYRLGIGLRNGRQVSVTFGGSSPSGLPYAMTELDGQPWIFEFPGLTYDYVQLYLTIPKSLR